MKRKTRSLVRLSSKMLMITLFLCVFSAATEAVRADPPPFLEVGKIYKLNRPGWMGESKMKVLEIDNKSGWIKVEWIGKNEITWMNFNLVPEVEYAQ